MQERLFTTRQVADLLGVTPREVDQWLRRGWLTHSSLPDGSERISEQGLVQFLKDRGIDIGELMAAAAGQDGSGGEVASGAAAPAPSDGPGPVVEVSMPAAAPAPPRPTAPREDATGLGERSVLLGAGGAEPVDPQPMPAVALPVPPLRIGEGSGRPSEAEASDVAAEAAMPREDQTGLAPTDDSALPRAGDGGGEPASAVTPAEPAPAEPSAPPAPGEHETTEPPAEPVSVEAAVESPPPARDAEDPPAEVPAEDEAQVEAADPAPEEPAADPAPVDAPPASVDVEPAPAEVAVEAVAVGVAPEADHIPADAASQVAEAILADAVALGATHIHLEPHAEGLVLRLRVDASLSEKPNFRRRLPPPVADELVGRLLETAGIETRQIARPASGSFGRTIDGRAVTFRLSAMPTTRGRRLVLAVRDAEVPPPSLSQIALSGKQQQLLEQVLTSAGGGLVLSVGLPGGGIDEVLRALAVCLCQAGRDVLTVEADAETAIPGACQAVVDPLAGYTFAEAARHLAGQDADAVLIGRLRDPVTAAAALEAALAGTTVLAGLVASTGPRALTLLGRMGLEPWPLTSALKAVVATRRLRKLCGQCKQRSELSAEAAAGADTAAEGSAIYWPAGCDRCARTGYAGTIRLHSLLLPDDEIAGLIRGGASAEDIEAAVRAAGVQTLRQLALEALRSGETSLEEISSVL